MKSVLVLALALASCGSDSGGGEDLPTLATFVAYAQPCSFSTHLCPLVVNASLAGTPDPSTWGMALSFGMDWAPVCEVGKSYDLSGGFLNLGAWPSGKSYEFRACVWNKKDGTMSGEKVESVRTPVMLLTE